MEDLMRKKVLVTGAGGVIAQKVLPGLAEKYDLILLDKKTVSGPGTSVVADLLDRDRDAYREFFQGVHAVIHSAFARPDTPENRFWAELDNVVMAYNVYQTCVEERVRRVIVMSSNHAADYYESLILDGKLLSIGPETPPKSDNYYGWAKIAYEALGFAFAVGTVGDGYQLENVQLRIGAPRETDIDTCKQGDTRKLKRDLGAYLSLRDELQLIEKSIEAESIADSEGVPFQIFYGVSGNRFNFWAIENARRIVGYAPEDDSIVHFKERVGQILGLQ
jgi:hypothetical protein